MKRYTTPLDPGNNSFKESLQVRLRSMCVGHPYATIAWPHRILHEAADELTAANARIAELEALLVEAETKQIRSNLEVVRMRETVGTWLIRIKNTLDEVRGI